MKLNTIYSRCLILCLLFVTVTSVLAYRLVKIQILDSAKFKKQAIETYSETEVLKAKRGLILDKRENPLVSNVFTNDLIADRYRLDDPRMAALGLAYATSASSEEWNSLDDKEKNRLIERNRRKIFLNTKKQEEENSVDQTAILMSIFSSSSSFDSIKKARDAFDPEALDQLIQKHEDYAMDIIAQRLKRDKNELLDKLRNTKGKRIVLVKNLSDDEAEVLKKDLREMRVQGFNFEKSARRSYIMPKALVHVLGFTNFTNKGQMGVEKSMDPYLSGQDGFRRIYRNAKGLPLSSSMDRTKPAVHGLHLRLTIDMNIQAIAEEELDAGLKEFQAERGAIIIVEPKTGDIMAMVSRPSFDLNERLAADMVKGSPNFCIQGFYEPGSTFKIVPISGALDAKAVTLETPIHCGGKVYEKGPIRLTDTGSYGTLKVWQVIQKSSNIGSYLIALQLDRTAERTGSKTFVSYIRDFGFAQKTGIDLSNEDRGVVHSGKNPTDFSRMAIGYSIGVTPIQIIMAYAAIANDGVLMRPRLIDRIFDSNNKTVHADVTKPQQVRRVVSSKVAKEVRTALATVTKKGGTGTRGAIEGFSVGAKTGTARRHAENKGYIPGQYTLSFCGMVPAENPAFICLVVVDNPRTKTVTHYGGAIAGPIFQKVGTRVVKALNMTPTEQNTPGTTRNNR